LELGHLNKLLFDFLLSFLQRKPSLGVKFGEDVATLTVVLGSGATVSCILGVMHGTFGMA
jgi:hypothetical protein